jgi:hypothetical protein
MELFSHWPWVRALGQSAAEVTVRNPGCRWLSGPTPAGPYAVEDYEFAWLAATAYQGTPAAARRLAQTVDREEHVDPAERLRAAGWDQWKGFPGRELQLKIDQTHLRVQVWEKPREGGQAIVAVTFGGTVFNNEMDWRANCGGFSQERRTNTATSCTLWRPRLSKSS